MTLIKTRARGLKLDDTFAFTGTVSGAGGGKINQVITNSFTMDQDRTETSLTEINSSCRVTITPSASDSKILYLISFPLKSASNNTGFFINIYKSVGGASYGDDSGELSRYANYSSATNNNDVASFHYVSSPNTTSAVIYSPYVKVNQNTVNFGNNGKFNATVMEILA